MAVNNQDLKADEAAGRQAEMLVDGPTPRIRAGD